jgi:hypothetical protein
MAGYKSNYLSNAVLALFFNGTPIPGIADNAASGALTTLYVALHTADPGVGGSQTTNEVTYGGYARVGVARTSGGWVLSGEQIVPGADITWPVGTSGSGTAPFFSIGTASTGAGHIMYAGPLTPAAVLGNGQQPVMLAAGSAITEG